MPVLVAKDRKSKLIRARVVPQKGANAYAIKIVGGILESLRYKRILLKRDQEPAIMALKSAAVKLVQLAIGKEILFEESPVGASAANGLAENAVKETKGVIRSLRLAFDELHGIKLDVQSPVLPWMVRHAGSMISRARRGQDGGTAWELRRGKPYSKRLPAFGEKVMYLKAG